MTDGRLANKAEEAQRRKRAWQPDPDLIASVVRDNWSLPGEGPLVVGWLGQGAQGDAFLVQRGAYRWVAKLIYQHRHHAEAGLRAAAVVDAGGLRSCVATLTTQGEPVAMVEGPPGHWHPLAMLAFVPGQPLNLGDYGAAGLLGELTARIHLLLGAYGEDWPGRSERFGSGYPSAPFDAPEGFGWLPGAVTQAVKAGASSSVELSQGPILWEGPRCWWTRPGSRA